MIVLSTSILGVTRGSGISYCVREEMLHWRWCCWFAARVGGVLLRNRNLDRSRLLLREVRLPVSETPDRRSGTDKQPCSSPSQKGTAIRRGGQDRVSITGSFLAGISADGISTSRINADPDLLTKQTIDKTLRMSFHRSRFPSDWSVRSGSLVLKIRIFHKMNFEILLYDLKRFASISNIEGVACLYDKRGICHLTRKSSCTAPPMRA
jgi:hypothetical protein